MTQEGARYRQVGEKKGVEKDTTGKAAGSKHKWHIATAWPPGEKLKASGVVFTEHSRKENPIPPPLLEQSRKTAPGAMVKYHCLTTIELPIATDQPSAELDIFTGVQGLIVGPNLLYSSTPKAEGVVGQIRHVVLSNEISKAVRSSQNIDEHIALGSYRLKRLPSLLDGCVSLRRKAKGDLPRSPFAFLAQEVSYRDLGLGSFFFEKSGSRSYGG